MHVNRLQKLIEFVEADPNDPFLHYALATEYLKLDERDKALQYFLHLVEAHPAYVGTYYHLGKLFEVLGRGEEASATYEAGMKIARTARDFHALSELQAAYAALSGLDYDDD